MILKQSSNNPLRSLGSYRNKYTSRLSKNEKNLGELTDLPLDTGIPKSGEINFSDFYGKQLNIVVDLHSTGSDDYNLDVYTDRFVNGDYDKVGRYKNSINKNGWRGGKKVIIHINKTFGSAGAVINLMLQLKQVIQIIITLRHRWLFRSARFFHRCWFKWYCCW